MAAGAFRVQGLSLAFPTDLTTGSYKIGQLIQLDTNSKIVASGGLLTFPLFEDFNPAAGDKSGSVSITGVAKVRVGTITGIDVGSPLAFSSNAAILAAADAKFFGHALEKPTIAGQEIAVLLCQGVVQSVEA